MSRPPSLCPGFAEFVAEASADTKDLVLAAVDVVQPSSNNADRCLEQTWYAVWKVQKVASLQPVSPAQTKKRLRTVEIAQRRLEAALSVLPDIYEELLFRRVGAEFRSRLRTMGEDARLLEKTVVVEPGAQRVSVAAEHTVFWAIVLLETYVVEPRITAAADGTFMHLCEALVEAAGAKVRLEAAVRAAAAEWKKGRTRKK